MFLKQTKTKTVYKHKKEAVIVFRPYYEKKTNGKIYEKRDSEGHREEILGSVLPWH